MGRLANRAATIVIALLAATAVGHSQTPSTPLDEPHVAEAWKVAQGSRTVVVAVIDSGIDYTHEDLAANMFRNEADCNTNGVDDDSNGYIDDCYGIDTAATTADDRDPMDDNGHGTHV